MSADVGDGSAGEVGFPKESYQFVLGENMEAVVPVARMYGAQGSVRVDWFTRENTAVSGHDFVETGGVVEFGHGQKEGWIKVPLLDRRKKKGFSQRSFIIELGQPDGEATVGRYETNVLISPPGSLTGLMFFPSIYLTK